MPPLNDSTRAPDKSAIRRPPQLVPRVPRPGGVDPRSKPENRIYFSTRLHFPPRYSLPRRGSSVSPRKGIRVRVCRGPGHPCSPPEQPRRLIRESCYGEHAYRECRIEASPGIPCIPRSCITIANKRPPRALVPRSPPPPASFPASIRIRMVVDGVSYPPLRPLLFSHAYEAHARVIFAKGLGISGYVRREGGKGGRERSGGKTLSHSYRCIRKR